MFEFWTGAPDLPVYGFLIRALIVYVYVFIMVKLLGQRSMNSINPIDFIFGVIIGDIVGEPLSSGDLPLGGPLAAAALIAGLHLALSVLALHTPRFRRVIEDEPIILVRHGKILKKEMKKAKVTIESLLMDLRLLEADLKEVDYAILEANGQISVIKQSQYQSVTAQDMSLSTNPKGYPTVLIEDGNIILANVKKVGTVEWLREQVTKHGYGSYKDIFLMTMDEGGQIYISPQENQT
ncbi:DUF421 domain-containing protein [Alkalihalophilus pseudofirmus]|uniref:DUF421 domain-containing protein n=1 Tax=Alkalihalobacterium alkalinitrilicum TaxID=427920 RepID=UPI00094C8E1E|nr:DUF421 domain-containing protein [Alkalihalobacterium alkalinitrilicum]OLO40366.1 DUF421 domain-containing protein [Alkalihalophilus pseudofirmus]